MDRPKQGSGGEHEVPRGKRFVVIGNGADYSHRIFLLFFSLPPPPPPFHFSSLLLPPPDLTMPNLPEADPLSTSSHMMKTTKRGRPFLKVRRLLHPHVHASLPTGYLGLIRYPHRLAPTGSPQAIFPYFPPLIFHVRPLSLLLSPYI